MLHFLTTAEGPDFFTMANLFSEDTGLPFVVWISPRGNARRDARIKVARSQRATEFVASVAIRPEPPLVAGQLAAEDLAHFQQKCRRGFVPENAQIQSCRASNPTKSGSDFVDDALALAIRWIELNRDVLLAYWDGGIQRTKEVFERLQPLA